MVLESPAAHTGGMAEATAGHPPGHASPTAHWDTIYQQKHADEMSWHEPAPGRSLDAILALAPPPGAAIIDVGGGTSRLVDLLLERGHENLTVADISPIALERARERLGDAASRVEWVVADLGADPDAPGEPVWARSPFAVWHDRAVFHFLTGPAQQDAYVARLLRLVARGGHVIIAGFDEHGPPRCSGLDVVRRGPEALSQALPSAFVPRTTGRFTHVTPWGAEQPFATCTWQRVA